MRSKKHGHMLVALGAESSPSSMSSRPFQDALVYASVGVSGSMSEKLPGMSGTYVRVYAVRNLSSEANRGSSGLTWPVAFVPPRLNAPRFP